MTMITNIKHFLDEKGEVPELQPEALELVLYLSLIIEAASENYDAPVSFASVQCRSTVERKPCPGDIEVWVFQEDNNIGWQCLDCGEGGVISEWEGTVWDKRSYVKH